MDEVVHVILAVDVAELAVGVARLFDFVADHLLLVVEVSVACLVGTLDSPHLGGGGSRSRVDSSWEATLRDKRMRRSAKPDEMSVPRQEE